MVSYFFKNSNDTDKYCKSTNILTVNRLQLFPFFLFIPGTVHVLLSYRADLRNTRDNKFVDEVIFSAHFTEEEVDFLLIRYETGADEGWIYGVTTESAEDVSFYDIIQQHHYSWKRKQLIHIKIKDIL